MSSGTAMSPWAAHALFSLILSSFFLHSFFVLSSFFLQSFFILSVHSFPLLLAGFNHLPVFLLGIPQSTVPTRIGLWTVKVDKHLGVSLD
jgi:hypothetical protein